MKKIALAAALAALSAAASAQSNVTLFGVLDAGVRYVKNGDENVKSASSNGLNTSRLGVRGVEDLGDGLRAGFWLESGINPDAGNTSDSARFWNRRATVSLLGGFGEVRIGRDYTPTYTGYADYDAFGDNGVGASSKFDSSLGTTRQTGTRADNLVTYFTPDNLGGFYSRLAVAAGEGVSGKKYVGGRLGYKVGPFDVSGAYGQTWVAPVGGDDKFKAFDVGAAYDLGSFKVLAYYQQNKFVDNKIANISIGTLVPLGNGQLRAQYTHANASGRNAAGASVDDNDADQIALGYVYNLSKRTALYTTAAYVKNKGRATFVTDANPPIAPGEKSTGVEAGIRHAF